MNDTNIHLKVVTRCSNSNVNFIMTSINKIFYLNRGTLSEEGFY